MKDLAKRLDHALVPQSLRQRMHYFPSHDDYLNLPKTAFEYAEDGLYTLHTAPFLYDERFQHAYALGADTGSWHGAVIRWRAYIACWAAQQAAQIEGDFVECGVNRGGLARAIIDYTDFGRLEKRFFLVDTFTGLVPEYLSETEKQKGFLEHFKYYQADSKQEVAATFSPFGNVTIIQGTVPDVLPEIPANQVAFVSLDMNCTEPEVRAAEFFWDRLATGGIILLDDYTQKLHSEQQVAFDRFTAARGTSVLALPTGQGMIVRV